MLRCQDRDMEGAMVSCRAMFNAGRAVGDEPTLVSMLVRAACRRITVQQLERVLAQGEPSPQSLAAFQKVLEDEDAENLFLIAVRGERGLMDGFLEQVQRGEVSHAQLKQSVAGLSVVSGDSGLTPEELLQLVVVSGSVKHERAEVLKAMNRAVEIAKLLPEEQGPKLAAWRESAKEGSLLVRKLSPSVVKVGNVSRRSHADLRCMIVMLAAERYRRERREHGGRWPDKLADLTPDYLKGVPTDPFDGKPIRFRRTADGVAVYSVGLDGEDDGGNLSDKWLDKGTDWGYRLWDVDKRRQAPK
jgi:hypothetical protein